MPEMLPARYDSCIEKQESYNFNRLVLFPGPAEGFFTLGIPVHRVLRVLEEAGAGLVF